MIITSRETAKYDDSIRYVPKDDDFNVISHIFHVMGDPTRLKIFWLLGQREMSIKGISSLLNISPPAVSHHISLLKDEGLITGSRKGREVYYRMFVCPATNHLKNTVEFLFKDTFSKQSSDRY